MPSQKNAVSRGTTGRSISPPAGSGPPAAVTGDGEGGMGMRAGGGGRNFSTRHVIDVTASWPTYQVFRVVTNQPSPSAVRFGPVTLSRLDRMLTCSPCRR